MAGDLVLQYLVEGGHQLSEISITGDDWPVTIDGLMDIIFMEHRSVAKLAPNHKHLTLLKVRMLLHFRFLRLRLTLMCLLLDQRGP